MYYTTTKNIWNSISEKVNQYQGWVEKKRCLKKRVILFLKNKIAVTVLHRYADQTSVLWAEKFCLVLNK